MTQPGRMNMGVRPLMVVTGMSGAGRSSALRALEDIGYGSLDNLPLAFLKAVIQAQSSTQQADQPLAVGIDVRSQGFDAAALLVLVQELKAELPRPVHLLYLDCDDEALVRRFTETRRRHPLAADRPIGDGIAVERRLIAGLRDRADTVIDTSVLTLADLKQMVQALAGAGETAGLQVNLVSFSYRYGLPREADLVFDVRFLRNPYYDLTLRPFDGRTPAVGAYVAADPDFQGFFGHVTALLSRLLPRYEAEGKSYLTIAFGCTGGKHRSVYVVERLGVWMRDQGYAPTLRHRESDRSQRLSIAPVTAESPPTTQPPV